MGFRKRKQGTTKEDSKKIKIADLGITKRCRKNICKGSPEQPVIFHVPVPVTPKATFDSLPVEMRDNILSRLDYDGMKTGRLVCQSWQKLIDRQLDFCPILSDDSFETVKNFNGNQPIRQLTVQDCTRTIPQATISRSSFAKTINHLVFKIGEGTLNGPLVCHAFGCWQIHNHDDWIPGPGTSEENILTLLRIHPSIKYLTIGPRSLANVKCSSFLSLLSFKCLTRLEITFGDDVDEYLIQDNTSTRPYQQLMKNNFPALQSFVYSCKADYKSFQLVVDVYFFVARHRHSLKYLHIDSFETYAYNFTAAVSNEDFQKLNSDLCSLQLKELYFRVMTFVPESFNRWKLLEQNFLRSQVKVEKLEIRCIEELNSALEFLPNCKDTLVDLTVISNLLNLEDNSTWETVEKFDCRWIQDCHVLKKLHLDFSEWDFFQECSKFPEPLKLLLKLLNLHSLISGRAQVKNFQYLPKSLKEVTFGGYISVPEMNILSKNLTDLETFSAHGCEICIENLRTVHDLLKYTQTNSIRLQQDTCIMVVNFARSLQNVGVELLIEDLQAIVITVDRSVFKPHFIQLLSDELSQ